MRALLLILFCFNCCGQVTLTNTGNFTNRILTWTVEAPWSIVRTGSNCWYWTSTNIISSNNVPYTNGLYYGVSAFDGVQESDIITFPSNRVENINIETKQTTNDWELLFTWKQYTNSMDSSDYSLLRINKVLDHWESIPKP